MNSSIKILFSLSLSFSLAVVSCGKKTTSSIDDGYSSQATSSSEVHESSSTKETCKNDLHDYVRYVPVDNGHQKACETCDTFIGEKENHNYFTNAIKYCPSCGYYDEEMAPYTLPDDFDVAIRTTEGTEKRKILRNTYYFLDAGIFTLSSPSNAHSAYDYFDLENARFFYDNQVDDGTNLFMLKETSSKEKIGTCKTIYTYTLYLYSNINPGSFSYAGGHISIGEQAIAEWLESHTPSNQVTYKYLSVQHHADDYRVPVPGTNAVIVEVTCEDCHQFLYQEVIHND